MWVKIVKTVVVLVARDNKFRELVLAILGVVLLPLIIVIVLFCALGKTEAEYNRNAVLAVIGESGNTPSGYGEDADHFYSGNDAAFRELMEIWDEKKENVEFEGDDERRMRIFLKATYYVMRAQGKLLDSDEDKEAFMTVFVGRKSAEDVFEELAGQGIGFDDTGKGYIYQIWCMVLHDGYIDPGEEESGLWSDFAGRPWDRRTALFRSPFLEDWTKHVSSEFGMREHPIYHTKKMHKGIDIAMPTGTEIHSCSSGTVLASDYNNSMGNYVRVAASNGYTLTYMHMSERKVKKGDNVLEGDVLGLVGSTGDSTGPHLHLGIQNPSGDYINPRSVLAVPRNK